MFSSKGEDYIPEWDELGEEKREKFIDRIRYVIDHGFIVVPNNIEEDDFIDQKAKQAYEKEVLGRSNKDPNWWMNIEG